VLPCSFTINFVDPDFDRKKVHRYKTQLFSWYWPGDDESILEMVTSIVKLSILSFMNAAIAGQSDPRWKIQELWGL